MNSNNNKFECCCCMPMRLGLRLVSFMTLLGGVVGVLSTYQLFSYLETDEIKAIVDGKYKIKGYLELMVFAFLLVRFAQFFCGVRCMQWVYEDSERNREGLKAGLGWYVVFQTLMQIFYYMVVCGLATTIIQPMGLVVGPNLSWGWFLYEITWFYYWSVARKYCDLLHLAKTDSSIVVNDGIPEVELESGKPV